MKTIVILLFLLLVGALLVNRQRVYVRDPLAHVTRDGVPQPGDQVFINYSNDVLLKRATPANTYVLVQDQDQFPGTPVGLTCLRWTGCMTAADHAPTFPLAWQGKGPYNPKIFMNSREVSFVDADGATLHITLR